MKRGGPLKRTGGLKRTELNRRSKKRSNHMREERVPLVKSLVEAGFGCEVGPVLVEFNVPGADGCTGKIDGLHERRKSGAGGSRTNHNNLIPACNYCNGLIEDQAGIVRELTSDLLVVREGDDEWEQLGARHDRIAPVQDTTDS